MLQADLIELGNSDGKYKGKLEIATTRSRDLLLTLTDEDSENSEKCEGSFYLTRANAKRLADTLLKAASK